MGIGLAARWKIDRDTQKPPASTPFPSRRRHRPHARIAPTNRRLAQHRRPPQTGARFAAEVPAQVPASAVEQSGERVEPISARLAAWARPAPLATPPPNPPPERRSHSEQQQPKPQPRQSAKTSPSPASATCAESLRRAALLAPKKNIHTLGLVGVLHSLHPSWIPPCCKAYGWADLTAGLATAPTPRPPPPRPNCCTASSPSAPAAAAEAQGHIRWRCARVSKPAAPPAQPTTQPPPATPVLPPPSNPPPPAQTAPHHSPFPTQAAQQQPPQPPQPWPASLPEQVRAVADALSASPVPHPRSLATASKAKALEKALPACCQTLKPWAAPTPSRQQRALRGGVTVRSLTTEKRRLNRAFREFEEFKKQAWAGQGVLRWCDGPLKRMAELLRWLTLQAPAHQPPLGQCVQKQVTAVARVACWVARASSIAASSSGVVWPVRRAPQIGGLLA